jgi:hypothetical protein
MTTKTITFSAPYVATNYPVIDGQNPRWFNNEFQKIQGSFAQLYAANLGTMVVSKLPAAGTASRTAFVTDATASTFYSIVAGGGAIGVPVFDDGTNWRIG